MRSFLRRVLCFVFLLGASISIGGESDSWQEKSWFRPELEQNDDAVCEVVHKDAERFFLTDKPWSGLRSPVSDFYVKSLTEAEHTPLSDNPDALDRIGSIQLAGKTVFYQQYTEWSNCCMGEQQLALADTPFLARERPQNALTPLENGFFWLFIANGETYVVTVSLHGDFSEVSVIEPQRTLRRVCKLSLIPQSYPQQLDEVTQALSKLESALAAVRGVEGNCGTGHFHSWRTRQMTQQLDMAPYRPWAILHDAQGPEASYATVETVLRQWQLNGLFEVQAIADYQQRLAEAIASHARFYVAQFALSEDRATKLAEQVIKQAIAAGFSNGEREVYSENEVALRKAIQARLPLSAIRSISLEGISRNPTGQNLYTRPSESVLDLTVAYPEALAYLLANGFEPNTANAFGKTPLMYAAQYNQLDAAKLLLAAGADPNAATSKPQDDCYYTLSTSNVTALHYAVRYSSAAFVELLLGAGADVFMSAENRRFHPDRSELALDWLHRYTSASSDELNPHIAAENVAALAKLLQLPSAAEQAAEAERRLQAARAAYQAGNTETAYRQLRSVLALKPDHEAALSDFALVALRRKSIGESLAASDKLIAASQNPALVANAWFNYGLTCEQHRKTEAGRFGSVFHNGRYYCDKPRLHAFLQSFKAAESAARKNAILALFNEQELGFCEIQYKREPIKLHFWYGQDPDEKRYQPLQFIFVLHPTSRKLEPRDFKWNRLVNKEVKLVQAKLKTSYSLGDHTITVLAADGKISFPYSMQGYTCKDATTPGERQML